MEYGVRVNQVGQTCLANYKWKEQKIIATNVMILD